MERKWYNWSIYVAEQSSKGGGGKRIVPEGSQGAGYGLVCARAKGIKPTKDMCSIHLAHWCGFHKDGNWFNPISAPCMGTFRWCLSSKCSALNALFMLRWILRAEHFSESNYQQETGFWDGNTWGSMPMYKLKKEEADFVWYEIDMHNILISL